MSFSGDLTFVFEACNAIKRMNSKADIKDKCGSCASRLLELFNSSLISKREYEIYLQMVRSEEIRCIEFMDDNERLSKINSSKNVSLLNEGFILSLKNRQT